MSNGKGARGFVSSIVMKMTAAAHVAYGVSKAQDYGWCGSLYYRYARALCYPTAEMRHIAQNGFTGRFEVNRHHNGEAMHTGARELTL